MLHRIILISVLIPILSVKGVGQNLNESRSFISTSLLTPTIYTAPRYNLGYLQSIDDRWMAGLDLEYGSFGLMMFSNQRNSGYLDEDYRSWSVRPEVYRILRPDARVKKYLSLDLFFIKHTDHLKDPEKKEDRYYYDDGEEVIFDEAMYSRNKSGFTVYYGILIPASKRLWVDISGGLGMKFLNVQYTHVQNPENVGPGSDAGVRLGTYDYMRLRGKSNNIHFNMDIKVLWRLGK